MGREFEPRTGDGVYAARYKTKVGGLGLKARDTFLTHLGSSVGQFASQVGASAMTWRELKDKLGEDGWPAAVAFTTHMYQTLETDADESKGVPWRLMTISLAPARRGTDASNDQRDWIDDLIEEAQRHCARLKRTAKAGSG